MAYAAGKKALGICDRCGFTVKLKDLKYEVRDSSRTGFRICTNCLDEDHPQLKIGDVDTSENISLFNPRPDTGEKDSTTYFGFNPVSSIGSVLRAELGIAKVQTAVQGGAASSTPFTLTGLSASASLGTATVISNVTEVAVTGNTSTGAIGSVNTLTGATFAVTVAAYYGANKYYIDGTRQATVTLSEGATYTFDQSDSSNAGHPLRLSTTSDGTHGSGSEYTTGVTTNGTPGSAGAYTRITVAVGTPTLYYYCTNHSGMGGQANTP